jgi:hypothetical protein
VLKFGAKSFFIPILINFDSATAEFSVQAYNIWLPEKAKMKVFETSGDSMTKAYLVGAGPGDPRLLTVAALDALRLADVILWDRLVGEEILALVNPTAEKIYVIGFRSFHYSCRKFFDWGCHWH